MALPFSFLLLFIAAVAGIVYPYYQPWKRRHFALAAVGTFVGLAITVPKPTPEEIAARKAAEEKEQRVEAAAKAREAQAEALQAHRRIFKKAAPALEVPPNYTRAEYGATFARVGAATFKRLNELEPGAAYAAAESRSCDRVNLAAVSDVSKPGAAVWFVDCADESRFMISQKDAEAALARFKTGKLAERDLERSCTPNTVAMCKATPAQKASQDKEIEYVTACDLLLQEFVVSPSSLDMHRWEFGFGKGNRVVIRRPFDSQNGFGAMIRSRYRREIDAATSNVTGFAIQGPMGTQKII